MTNRNRFTILLLASLLAVATLVQTPTLPLPNIEKVRHEGSRDAWMTLTPEDAAQPPGVLERLLRLDPKSKLTVYLQTLTRHSWATMWVQANVGTLGGVRR